MSVPKDSLGNPLDVGEKVVVPRDVLKKQIVATIKEVHTLGNPPYIVFEYSFAVAANPMSPGQYGDLTVAKTPEAQSALITE